MGTDNAPGCYISNVVSIGKDKNLPIKTKTPKERSDPLGRVNHESMAEPYLLPVHQYLLRSDLNVAINRLLDSHNGIFSIVLA